MNKAKSEMNDDSLIVEPEDWLGGKMVSALHGAAFVLRASRPITMRDLFDFSGLKTDAFAQAIGVTAGTLRQMLAGISSPSKKRLDKALQIAIAVKAAQMQLLRPDHAARLEKALAEIKNPLEELSQTLEALKNE